MTTNEFFSRPEPDVSRRTLDLASAVVIEHRNNNTPLSAFLDSQASDLDDMAIAVGATVNELITVRDFLRGAFN